MIRRFMNSPQIRWAIVGYRGYIRSDTIRFTRKAVIADMIADFRKFASPQHNGTGLTDAQFWRRIKHLRNYSVKRISMKVVR